MRVIFTLIFSLVLTGCGSISKEPTVIHDVKTIEVKIPEEILQNVSPPELISAEEYLKLKPYEREEYLAKYINDLITQIEIANTILNEVKKLNNRGKINDSQSKDQ